MSVLTVYPSVSLYCLFMKSLKCFVVVLYNRVMLIKTIFSYKFIKKLFLCVCVFKNLSVPQQHTHVVNHLCNFTFNTLTPISSNTQSQCPVISITNQSGRMRRSGSFTKLRASLKRSSAKLVQKLKGKGPEGDAGGRYAVLQFYMFFFLLCC